MEDRIEIGDYIRNKEGYIGQVRLILFEELEENQKFYMCEKDNDLAGGYKKEIIKYSKNIVDLIEVGDYVNGYKVINCVNEKNSLIENYVDIESDMDSNQCTFWNDDIKDVVTKELFEKQKYKIGE